MSVPNVAIYVILYGPDGPKRIVAGKIVCEIPKCDTGMLKIMFWDLTGTTHAPQVGVISNGSYVSDKISHCGEGFIFDKERLGSDWTGDLAKRGYVATRIL